MHSYSSYNRCIKYEIGSMNVLISEMSQTAHHAMQSNVYMHESLHSKL